MESNTPLPVIDERGRLVGAVARATLLAALGNVPSTTDAIQIVVPGQSAGNDDGSQQPEIFAQDPSGEKGGTL